MFRAYHNKIWQNNYNICVDYENTTGSIIEKRIKYNDYKIGDWYYNQLNKIKNGTLDEIKSTMIKKLISWCYQ